ncbi:mitogen-activated protein kinase 15 isoform X3 [Cervus elaphus]|uniref:mitogen-activated protein kinase 15 isoform X3 n=1 Tax=Cervus canadensis TaxID=1574408 RepID=UPI001C9E32BD|nr:mitogen-activated protein kinase 15 isoform X3 [Cervus canadensis]XP_043735619.1 mitogen-activated protein kinase 15 isoform X3 [Cervus elaphus]
MGRDLGGRRRSVGSQGNRVQQLEPHGCLEASWFPFANMCAAEVDRHVAQRYLLKRRLGKGAYGIVWKAVDRRTGEVVAIKKIFDAFKDKTDAQRTFREIMLLQEFGDHPNIVRLLDVIPAENDRDIYLVFESMDTDLNAVICKGTLLKDTHKRYIFYQLLRATKFIHSGRVIHRDQKPSNVLLDASCLVKLCDFGLARPLSGLPEVPEGHALTEYVATRWYRAPEVLLSSSWYTPGVDMWSLGCILGEMLQGRPLFPGTSTLHQLELILEAIPPPSKEGPGRHWMPSCPPIPLQTPWTSSRDSWCLPRTSGSAQPRPCSTPTCRAPAWLAPCRFHCPAREWTLGGAVRLPVQEGAQLSAAEYRRRLYKMILERRGHGRLRKETGLGGSPPTPEPEAQLPSGSPAWNPGRRPRSNPGHGPVHDAPGGAQDPPRQNSDPLHQPPPPGGPGRGARPGGATSSSWVKPSAREAAPSLTSQAAAQVAVRALIRSDRNPGRGATAPGAPRVPPRPPGAARPGRRMFGASAAQGAQGATRAALGGYSQAYGTVCLSALGCLPLLQGPRA